MGISKTQVGAAGEHLFCARVILGSQGLLELYRPVSDDDHTDVIAGRKGLAPALAIQVKTCRSLDRAHLIEVDSTFDSGEARSDAAFLYAVLFIPAFEIEACWVLPSPDFNALAYRTRSAAGHLSLNLRIKPEGDPRLDRFRVTPDGLGERILNATNGARLSSERPPPRSVLFVFV